MTGESIKLSALERSDRVVADVLQGTELTWDEAADAIAATLQGGEPTGRGADFVAELARRDEAALEDPHLYGWVHQHLGTARREAAFAAHTGREEKHVDSVVATQIYTPRWVADLLVADALGEETAVTVVDPACGGGQFLLAAFDRLVGLGSRPSEALSQLHGTDLDPTAIDAARRGLVRAAVVAGVDRATATKLVEERVVAGDGLDLAPRSFDVVLTNPPYMGSRSMPDDLKARLKGDFRPFHTDLATAFIKVCRDAARSSFAVLSQQNIWYLSRFEAARRSLLDQGHLSLFVHFGPHLFDVLKGEKASVVGFVMRVAGEGRTRFHDLRDVGAAAQMREAVIDGSRASSRPIDVVTRLPGGPVAHWLPDRLVSHFEPAPSSGSGFASGSGLVAGTGSNTRLGELFEVPGSQNKTGRNREFVQKADAVADPIAPIDAKMSAGARWRYYSKGGPYAPWWGIWTDVVDWSEEARGFYASNRTSNLLDDAWVDRVGLVYTDFGGRSFNARWKPVTALFDMAGPAIFEPDDDLDRLAALLVFVNSEPARELLNALNPSLHYQVRDVRNLPLPRFDELVETAATLGHRLVETARSVVETGSGAEALGELEEEANRLACAAYGVEPSRPLPRHSVLR